jgi:ADP-ribose pyrophosphatase YjhB (NUDIX family)/lambda repressor-like predicted transcriptional regulator
VPNERLRHALHAKQLTPADLAGRVGVDPKTVERWITTGRPPHPRHQLAVAAELDVPATELWPPAQPAQAPDPPPPWERRATRGAGIEHHENPEAPPANSVHPTASAIVSDVNGRILLTRRRDADWWYLPKTDMRPGEQIGDTAMRAVYDLTGLDVTPEFLIGVFTDVRYLTEYPDGEVRQELDVCFACHVLGGRLAPPDPTTEAAFHAADDLIGLQPPVHPAAWLRIQNYLNGNTVWFDPHPPA